MSGGSALSAGGSEPWPHSHKDVETLSIAMSENIAVLCRHEAHILAYQVWKVA